MPEQASAVKMAGASLSSADGDDNHDEEAQFHH